MSATQEPVIQLDDRFRLSKLRMPFGGRILANSDQLIRNPMVGLQACPGSLHAPLELAKLKIPILSLIHI